jgi:hypothetical protein
MLNQEISFFKKSGVVLIPFRDDIQEGGRYVFRLGRTAAGTWTQMPHSAFLYPNVVVMETGKSQNPDPRKRWVYDTIPNSSWGTMDVCWAYPDSEFGYDRIKDRRAYMFKDPQDFLLFCLRWQHTQG